MFEFMEPVAQSLGLSVEVTLGVGGAVAFIVALFVVNQLVATFSNTKKAPAAATFQEDQKRKAVRDRFLLTGPSCSGKTKLYYKLIGANITYTVSSSDVNETSGPVAVKVPQRILASGRVEGADQDSTFTTVSAKFVDVPGHFCFKKAIQVESTGAKAIILLLDAKEKAKFGDAAEILYDLLGDIEVISEELPILVVCNKQDIPFAKTALQVERELVNEIEQIRKVRKASQQQEQDTANRADLDEVSDDDQQAQSGYLESLKGKFSFEQVPNQIEFCGSSVLNDQIDDVLRFVVKHA